jgi:3-dehydroshikimate dehydratase
MVAPDQTTGDDAWLAGLCSVTLRAQSIAEVVAIAVDAGLAAVEWGGDVHVPPGDLAAAADARRRTEDAGLQVVSYGSYLFCRPKVGREVDAVLDVAEGLGTTFVRAWCPFGVEPGASAAERAEVAEGVGIVAAAAAARGLAVYLEFHGGTLTASMPSALELLDAVGATNLFIAWQPPYWAPQELDADRADLAAIGDRLGHLHVYQWDPDGTRHRLATDDRSWPARLRAASQSSADAVAGRRPFGPRAALLEFVPDDDPAAVAGEAATLRAWLSELDQRERHP